MAKAKYPLAALLTVRENATTAGKEQLAAKLREERARAAEREQAEAQLRAHEQAAQAAEHAHQRELRTGELRVSDLALRAGEVYAVAQVLAAHSERAASAAELQQSAEREAALAQGRLAGLRAEEEVVRLDRERFTRKHEQAQLAREEEAAEEAWRKRT
jgi:hypothetical protein